MCGGRHCYFGSPKVFLSWFGIGSFLGGNVAIVFTLLLFIGMRFSGVTLSLVSTVNPELTDRSVQNLSTSSTSGAGAYDWVINFGPLLIFLSW